jgi:hypothetical protein
MPEGSMPEPPGSGVTSPARRNRTRSINRLSPVDAPDVSEMGRGYCHRRGKVKGFQIFFDKSGGFAQAFSSKECATRLILSFFSLAYLDCALSDGTYGYIEYL